MGKKVRETLVGIFIVAGVVLFIVIYTWLTGRIGMRNTREVKVYYSDVGGLRVGDPVLIYGIEKGKIRSLAIENTRVLVVVSVSKDVPIPEDSRFALRSVSYLGGDKYIKITPGQSATPGTVFEGESESFDLESMASELKDAIAAIQGFKMPDMNNIGGQITAVVDKNVKNLARMVAQPTERLGTLIERMDSVTVMIKGEGTIGQLLRSDDLYQELRETNKSLKALIDDIMANPKKYINVKLL
jgi:phospholipid/cholesterol/gamma-HCH transport system substrate-binding protein